MSNHQCKECNGPFTSRQYNADFCSNACRSAFNNRRMKRGAVLYDLLMMEQGDPKAFEANKLKDRARELIERFRQDDEQAGRKRTWKRPNDVMYDTAALLR